MTDDQPPRPVADEGGPNVDVVYAALEDGYRPPADPERWDRIYIAVTGEPCPRCGTAIGLILGPSTWLETYVPAAMDDYAVSVSAAWTDGYDHPVYLYCDNPVCSWHGVAEWRRVRPALEVWIGKDAPTWQEQAVERGGT